VTTIKAGDHDEIARETEPEAGGVRQNVGRSGGRIAGYDQAAADEERASVEEKDEQVEQAGDSGGRRCPSFKIRRSDCCGAHSFVLLTKPKRYTAPTTLAAFVVALQPGRSLFSSSLMLASRIFVCRAM